MRLKVPLEPQGMGKEQFPKGMEVKGGKKELRRQRQRPLHRGTSLGLWSWEGPFLGSAIRMEMFFPCF